MTEPLAIQIRPFTAADQEEVRELILSGLEEHWGTRDPLKNPDLDDIDRSYADAMFLVACKGNSIVGTGALVPRSDKAAEIVRMSVAAGRRRQGLGSMILKALLRQAEGIGITRVVLETTASWHDAVRFYLRHGFEVTHYKDDDVYFALDLRRSDPCDRTETEKGSDTNGIRLVISPRRGARYINDC